MAEEKQKGSQAVIKGENSRGRPREGSDKRTGYDSDKKK